MFGVDTVSATDVWTKSVPTSENETIHLDVSPFVEVTLKDGLQIPSVIFPKYNNYPLREDFDSHATEIIIPVDDIGIKINEGKYNFLLKTF